MSDKIQNRLVRRQQGFRQKSRLYAAIRKSAGFSLLELLAVMSIMALLSTMAVTSYFTAIRGMTRRSAVKHLANSIILARQRACLEGVRVSVMIFNEVSGYDADNQPIVVPSYVVCKEVGRVTTISGTKLVDEFTPLDQMFGVRTDDTHDEQLSSGYLGSMRLYNLTAGKWWQVTPEAVAHNLTSRYSPYSQKSRTIVAYAFEENSRIPNANRATWAVGDVFGLEAAAPGALPTGFKFKNLDGSSDALPENLNQSAVVTFLPDGTAQEDVEITIKELMPPAMTADILVKKDGSIRYD